MTTVTTEAAAPDMPAQRPLPAAMTLLIATACGLTVANLYYAQPLLGPIAASLGLHPGAAGLVVTLTQLGYGAGLLLIVPLGDIVENRRLILVLVTAAALALLAAALSRHPVPFLLSALAVGLASVAVQVLVGYAAHLAPDASRGQVVGNVMSGLMLGIMLARPVASLIAQVSSWHVVFYLSAALMLVVAVVLAWALPPRVPATRLDYGALLRSIVGIARTTPVLRRRALYHSCLFGAFSLFWTTTPLLLAGPYHLSQGGIALFALAGVAGALAAPVAGRCADRGWSELVTGIALAAACGAFLVTHLAAPGSVAGLALLVAAAILLDAAVTSHLVVSQRAIFSLGVELRGRANGVFMAIFFVGGAAGSAAGGWAFAHGGWLLASCFGAVMPAVAFGFYALGVVRPRGGVQRVGV